jgi:hypothetical protein
VLVLEEVLESKHPNVRILDALNFKAYKTCALNSWILTLLKKSTARCHRNFEAMPDLVDQMLQPYNMALEISRVYILDCQ